MAGLYGGNSELENEWSDAVARRLRGEFTPPPSRWYDDRSFDAAGNMSVTPRWSGGGAPTSPAPSAPRTIMAGQMSAMGGSPAAPAIAAAPAAVTPPSVTTTPPATASAPTAASSAPTPVSAPTIPAPITPTAVPQGNADVAPRLNALLAEDNPLMQQARSQGMAAGNRRGLLNSSMAGRAAQGEAYKVAAPIAMQEAAQVHQTNLAERDIGAQMDRLRAQAGFTMQQIDRQGEIASASQVRDLTAQMERLRFSSSADDQRQARDIAAQLDRLNVAGNQQLAAIGAQGQVQSGLQSQAAQAEMARLQTQIAANAQQLRDQSASEMARLQASLSNANSQQQVEIQAQMERLQASTAAELERQRIAGEQQLSAIGAQGQVQGGLQSQAAAAEMARLQASLGNANAQQRAEIEAQMERLRATSTAEMERTQFAAAAQRELTNLQGSLQQTLQSQANDQQLQRMGAEFGQQRTMQATQDESAMARLRESGVQELARLAAAQQAEMTRLQTQIASSDRQAIAQSTINIFQAEAAMRTALLGNTSMPAAERAAYEAAITQLGAPARAFINQLYTQPTNNAGTAPAPGGGSYAPPTQQPVQPVTPPVAPPVDVLPPGAPGAAPVAGLGAGGALASDGTGGAVPGRIGLLPPGVSQDYYNMSEEEYRRYGLGANAL